MIKPSNSSLLIKLSLFAMPSLMEMLLLLGQLGPMLQNMFYHVHSFWQEGQSHLVVWSLVGALLCSLIGFLGVKRVRKLRHTRVDPTLGSEIHLFRDTSLAPILALRSKLITVHSLLLSFTRGGFTMVVPYILMRCGVP